MVISTIVGKQTGQTQTTWIEEVGGGGWGVCVWGGWKEFTQVCLAYYMMSGDWMTDCRPW